MSDYNEDIKRASRVVTGHVMCERPSRSFDFRTPGNGSIYAFALTWSPGTVSFAGDMGEMTVTHYNALWYFEPGMRWLADAHWEYLLGKTAVRKEVSAEATADYIVEIAQDQQRSWGERGLADKLKDRHPDIAHYRGVVFWQALRRELVLDLSEMSAERIAETCAGELRLSDFYGAHRYPPHAVRQITAIQHGARMICAALNPEAVAA